jgi:uncharacterized protein (TIGR04255 family)
MEKSGSIYKKTYLTNVIFRVDFPKFVDTDPTKTLSILKDAFKDSFPDHVETPGGLFEYQIDQEDFVIKKEKRVIWEFSDKEQSKKVTITPEFVSLEHKKYSNFETFFKDINLVFNFLTDVYKIKICKRIGLRYINQINLSSGDPLDWKGLIHPNLLSVEKGFTKDNEIILRSMHFLEAKEKENKLIFQFGLANSEYPNPIARKEFILDYDCSSKEEISISQIYDKVKEYNEMIVEWFERSITDDLRHMMRGDK